MVGPREEERQELLREIEERLSPDIKDKLAAVREIFPSATLPVPVTSSSGTSDANAE